jgi:putative DNA primase/helicase
MGQWLAEKCDLREGEPRFWDTIANLYASWSDYARAAGDDPGTVKSFGPAMRRKGFQPHRTNSVRGFRGVRVQHQPSYREVTQ